MHDVAQQKRLFGDTTWRGPGEAECPLDNERLHANAEFGATDGDVAVERPLIGDGAQPDEAVS